MTATRTGARTSTLDRATANRLAADEYDRVAALFRSLSPDQWTAPTNCPGWDVRTMAAHMLGMVEMTASLIEQRRQTRRAGARAQQTGEPLLDALTGVQVDERAHMSANDIVERFAARGPAAAKARRRAPGFIRRRAMPQIQDVGDHKEVWTFGYLLEVILTRDPWMHRIDITQATGATLELTPEHDGAIVADVVAEWAARHGHPFSLTLTGPAGGKWSSGVAGPEITLDATEFCSIIAGRGSADGLLRTLVPF